MKAIPSINCIESDDFRIVISSDELFMAIFDIKSRKLWFNLLGGSKTVVPKSFVKHPNYEGFHILEVTRNSIVSAIGNLIREYNFTFKYKKKIIKKKYLLIIKVYFQKKFKYTDS